MRKELTVVALGGNALIRADEEGTYAQQRRNVEATANALASLVDAGHRLVITHGNGPQVGNLLLQQEAAGDRVPAMPLHVCGAQSQGQIGYMLQQALRDALQDAGVPRDVVTVVTQVLVDPDSAAFDNPTKPVGPFYDSETAERLRTVNDWTMVEDAGRGYRRVVPSPEPLDFVEKETIRRLVATDVIVIASGGGGVPVARDANGHLHGVDGVIDKDRAAARLATLVDARLLLILTDVDRVALEYGTPRQRALDEVTIRDLRRYCAEGHFAPGSMKPKIEGAVRFLTNGGARAIITRPELAVDALAGRAGTRIIPDPE